MVSHIDIRIYCAYTIINNGSPLQSSATGLVLADGMKLRCLSFYLYGSDILLSQLQSVRLSLLAVDKQSRSFKVNLHTNSRLAINYLKKINNRYELEPSNNQLLVKKLRTAYDTFSDLHVFIDNSSSLMTRAKELAKECARSTKQLDFLE